MNDAKRGELFELAKKTWTETITTSVVRSFTKEEWDNLVVNFATSILKHPANAKVVGFSLSEQQSALFTKNDLPRLLVAAFGEDSLMSNPHGWVMEACAALRGVKSIHLQGVTFAARISTCWGGGGSSINNNSPSSSSSSITSSSSSSSSSSSNMGPPPKAVVKKDNAPIACHWNDVLSDIREQQSKKPKKTPLSLIPVRSHNVEDDRLDTLVMVFFSHYCQTDPSSPQLLSPGEVWIRFCHWTQNVRRPAVLPGTAEAFEKSFERYYPDNVQVEKRFKFYRGFKVKGLPNIPVYPPSNKRVRGE